MSVCLPPRRLTVRPRGVGRTRVCSCVTRVAAGRSRARPVRARRATRRRSGRPATKDRSARRSPRSPKPRLAPRKERTGITSGFRWRVVRADPRRSGVLP